MKRLFLLIATALTFYILGGLTIVYLWNQTPEVKTFPTGYQVLAEANKYRESQGKNDLILYQPLCNNIVERAQNFKENNNHEGLSEFAAKWIPNTELSEIFTYSDSASGTIENFKNSPSHNLILLNETKACVYSEKGYTVILLSK